MGRSDSRHPVSIDAELAAQFALMGAAVEVSPKAAPDAFEVLPGAWDAVCAFLDCETQWRVAAGLGGLVWLGLDYAGVDVVLRRKGLADDVFADLQIMERAALEVFAEDR